MKKIFNVLLLVLGACLCLHAEDIITLRTGEDIAAKILEVSTTEIKYKRMDNVEGPTFVVPVSEVLIVRYENGSNQVFEQQPKVVNPYAYPAPVDYGTAGKVVPGMRYNEYRHLYNPSDYVRMPGDSHSPVAGGICSFLIPGLGQMICGEVGRGFAFFGGTVGCWVLTGVGAGLATSGAYAAGSGYATGGAGLAATGIALTLIGSIGWFAVDIWAIVDAVQVAKVKNMYLQDMRNMSSEVDIKLQPYVSTISTGYAKTPVAGLSLAVTF